VAHEFFVDWQPAIDTADTLLLCAELVRLAYAQHDVVAAALPSAGLDLALGGWLGGESLGDRWRSQGSDGFVAHAADAPFTVVAFRGTEPNKPEDLLADLAARAVPCTFAPGRVHRGFLAAYEAVRRPLRAVLDPLPAGTRVVFAGHSLGAAVATLAAADHAGLRGSAGCQLVTFGSPRVGDATFAASLAGVAAQRVVHCADVVTRVPPERFDQDAVADLLAGFVPDGWLGDGLTGALAAMADVALGHPAYVHVGAPHYIDRHDHLLAQAPDAPTCRRDREQARADYGLPAATDRPAWRWPDPGDGLVGLVRAAMARREPATPQVAWRDMADHAPINYLSPLSRRARH
jgi:hypothetical protein